MRHSASSVNASRGTRPAPEKAYKAQTSRTLAMARVMSVGLSLPASTARAMRSPAPMNRYALAPTAMQTRCASDATTTMRPASASETEPMVNIYICVVRRSEAGGNATARGLRWIKDQRAATRERFLVEPVEAPVRLRVEHLNHQLAVAHVLDGLEAVPEALRNGRLELARF